MTDPRNEADPSGPQQTAGWASNFPTFASEETRRIVDSLRAFVGDAGDSQVQAWRDSVPRLQRGAGEVAAGDERAQSYSAVLEYRLPLESRRTDAIYLVSNTVLVLELKAKEKPSRADIDQVAAYARDLRAYHRDCQIRPVASILVPTRFSEEPRLHDDVWVSGPQDLSRLLTEITGSTTGDVLPAHQFLSTDAYRPLPSLVRAARELFFSGEVREVWRARATTNPAVEYISRLAHEAAQNKTRHLVLVTGVPGAGKTLVGMRLVHAHFLDDLAVPRMGKKPSTPGLFLSGNGPLVEVLQYTLKGAGGGGKVFVRHVKDYLDRYVPRPDQVPPEHLLVFDEAQRAFTPDKVGELHKTWPKEIVRGEPHLLVGIAERIPEWSIIVGLIGTGQEIHLGEEGGLSQWRHALDELDPDGRWTVHAPALVEVPFQGSRVRTRWAMELNLDTSIRFHSASGLSEFIAGFLEPGLAREGAGLVAEGPSGPMADGLEGIDLYATRDLSMAKEYLRERYDDQPDARYGLLASSRDRDLERFEIDNSWMATRLCLRTVASRKMLPTRHGRRGWEDRTDATLRSHG